MTISTTTRRLAPVTLLLCTALASSAAGIVVDEQTLKDAILGTQPFSASDLAELDVNADNQVDVADMVFFLSDAHIPLDGYKWLIHANFNSPASNLLARSYTFAISVTGSTATVTTLDEFNPTADLLNQNLSGPNELPGANRPDYALTPLLPAGTTFTVTGTGAGFTLDSAVVTVPASDPTNPTEVTLSRSWTLSVSTNDAFSGDTADHGSITETLSGFVPTTAVSNGTVTLTRYSPNNLVELEQ